MSDSPQQRDVNVVPLDQIIVVEVLEGDVENLREAFEEEQAVSKWMMFSLGTLVSAAVGLVSAYDSLTMVPLAALIAITLSSAAGALLCFRLTQRATRKRDRVYEQIRARISAGRDRAPKTNHAWIEVEF